MKKNTMLCVFSLGITLFLSGCVTIDPTKKLATALKEPSEVKLSKPKSMLLDASLLEKQQINQKLGICGSSSANKSIDERIEKLVNADVIKNLRIGFSELSSLQDPHSINSSNKLVDFNKFSFMIGSEDAIGPFGGGLASVFGGGLLGAINQVSSNLFFDTSSPNNHSEDFFIKLLRFYLTQYADGKFVLRDGTKLAKPNGNIAHEKVQNSDGHNKDIVSASLDKGTVSGLSTVVLEAFYDYCHGMKVIAIEKGKISYIPYYGKTDSQTEGEDKKDLYNLAYTKKEVDDYLFGDENNNTPTIVKFLEKRLKIDLISKILQLAEANAPGEAR